MRVELPVDAHVPHEYVASERLRLEAYRRLSAATTEADVSAVRDELADRYGDPPRPVENLLEVARFRTRARAAGLSEVTLQGNHVRFTPIRLKDWQRVRLDRLYPRSLVKETVGTVLVPRPSTARVGGTPLRDVELLAWAAEFVDAVLLATPASARSA
jgi:transcription-repair coupling factor (superfamily II helicase)